MMREGMHRVLVALLCALACGALACGRRGASQASGPEPKVLARVKGEAITDHDVAAAAVQALGPAYAGALTAEQRRKLLDSLVVSRAMAQAAEATLGEKERRDLESRVRAFREKLLVSHYLATHGAPPAPTSEEVEAYYAAHPERFGGGSVRSYELLVGTRELAEGERTKLTKALAAAASSRDWAKLAQEMAKQTLPIAHRRSEGGEDAAHPRLAQLMRGTRTGQTSGLAFIEGRPYVVRVTGETPRAPRALDEVRAEIREALAARATSEAIEKLSAAARAAARVEYLEK